MDHRTCLCSENSIITSHTSIRPNATFHVRMQLFSLGIKMKVVQNVIRMSDSQYENIYGPNSAGREKSAWNVINLPALQESPSPNCWSGNLLLLVYWSSIVCKYLTEFSPSWDHFKVPNRFIEFLGKNCLRQIFHFTQFDTTTKIKSVGHLL